MKKIIIKEAEQTEWETNMVNKYMKCQNRFGSEGRASACGLKGTGLILHLRFLTIKNTNKQKYLDI